MADENALAIPKTLSLVPTNYTQEDIDSVASSSDFFKRVQLMGGNSEACKEGRIQMGHYAYVTDKETMKDLGNQVDVLVCGMRLKAMQITDDEVINVYDPRDPEFDRIRATSASAEVAYAVWIFYFGCLVRRNLPRSIWQVNQQNVKHRLCDPKWTKPQENQAQLL